MQFRLNSVVLAVVLTLSAGSLGYAQGGQILASSPNSKWVKAHYCAHCGTPLKPGSHAPRSAFTSGAQVKRKTPSFTLAEVKPRGMQTPMLGGGVQSSGSQSPKGRFGQTPSAGRFSLLPEKTNRRKKQACPEIQKNIPRGKVNGSQSRRSNSSTPKFHLFMENEPKRHGSCSPDRRAKSSSSPTRTKSKNSPKKARLTSTTRTL